MCETIWLAHIVGDLEIIFREAEGDGETADFNVEVSFRVHFRHPKRGSRNQG